MEKFGRKKNILEEAYFPDRYINRLTDINSEFFKEENVKGVIIDIDNTVIDVKKNMIDGLLEWKNELAENDIQVVILSNTIDKPKVLKIAEFLGVDYFIFGRKPNLIGFTKAKRHLGLPSKNIAVIGDQIFTDILGANRAGMLSILVNPLQEKLDYFLTRWKRPLEEAILANYLEYIRETECNPKKYMHIFNALEKRIENQKRGKETFNTTKLSKMLEQSKLEENRGCKSEELEENIEYKSKEYEDFKKDILTKDSTKDKAKEIKEIKEIKENIYNKRYIKKNKTAELTQGER